MKIDVITGNASDMEEGANLRKLLVRFLIKIKLLNQRKQNVLQNNNLEMMLL